jgi:hypothetical protein
MQSAQKAATPSRHRPALTGLRHQRRGGYGRCLHTSVRIKMELLAEIVALIAGMLNLVIATIKLKKLIDAKRRRKIQPPEGAE